MGTRAEGTEENSPHRVQVDEPFFVGKFKVTEAQ